MTVAFRTADLFSVPGWLSLSRVGFAALFPFLVDCPRWALVVVAAAGFSDYLDGWYARRFHITTATGAIIDPITDKLFTTSVMASLIVSGRLSLFDAALLSVRELMELPLLIWMACEPRARSIRSQHLGANLAGKLTTALQFGALIAALLTERKLGWWMSATALAGAFAAFAYWVKFRRALALAL